MKTERTELVRDIETALGEVLGHLISGLPWLSVGILLRPASPDAKLLLLAASDRFLGSVYSMFMVAPWISVGASLKVLPVRGLC